MRIYFQDEYYTLQNYHQISERNAAYASMVQFISDWINNRTEFQFKTSGSTGTPQKTNIQKSQIESSVLMTKKALNLSGNEQVLICLSPEYIASIMMVARCLILELDMIIVEPISNPFKKLPHEKKISFASFVPFQIEQIINDGCIEQLENIRNILIGGAGMPQSLRAKLKSLESNIYESYGMTETVSHIALMNIKSSDYFHPLEGIEIDVDDRSCLRINGPVTANDWVQTNDVIELNSDGTFALLGRADNIINSGGIKIIPEELENHSQKVLSEYGYSYDFFFHGMKDDTLGQKVSLFFETEAPKKIIVDHLKNSIIHRFSKYHQPREVHVLNRFLRTDSGKLKRRDTLQRFYNNDRS